MLFGKMVQVLPNPIEGGFRAVYGIDNVESKHQLRNALRLTFGNISFNNMSPNVTKTYICGGYTVKKTAKNFKEILIFNGDLSQEDNEEFLFVIIPYANKIKTKSKKIAGKYPQEAILEMHEGDTLELSKNGKKDIFMAVKAGNEIFLIRKSR